ncbi:hypothetical protein DK37_03940 [Halomonas sp. SUBG004]|nr:hypothetical protein DK37_03940 [Halomonas sp. SUBG004]
MRVHIDRRTGRLRYVPLLDRGRKTTKFRKRPDYENQKESIARAARPRPLKTGAMWVEQKRSKKRRVRGVSPRKNCPKQGHRAEKVREAERAESRASVR